MERMMKLQERAVEGNGEKDYVVVSGGDHWGQRPDDAPVARAVRRARL
jgi:hypothetical protein